MLKTKASFRISGALDPDKITQLLAISPSYTHRKGEPDRFGEMIRSNIWVLKSELGDGSSLEEQIQSLFDKMNHKSDVIKNVDASCRLDIFCSITSTGESGFSLTPKLLSVISELNVNLEVSIIAA
ncbi:MAG TPA: DUF4279 domain-containing protein [Pyrinomonadaceae bacterium]|nr:DUF4279 domain-containing protein [Pyrinomonadaceae bacterium]HMP67011.1 DUF4279 domain-containing protein [Pyrinomonadaceae bacterium]